MENTNTDSDTAEAGIDFTHRTHRAYLEITLPEHEAQILTDTLKPESDDQIPRTEIRVTREAGASGKTGFETVRIDISAMDTSALRAALNSILRLVHTAMSVVDALPGKDQKMAARTRTRARKEPEDRKSK